MKKRNIAAAILLASMMATSVGFAAFPVSAADYTLTIDNTSEDNAAHTYKVYQIFKADLTEENGSKVLSNITAGENLSSLNDLVTELKSTDASSNPKYSKFGSCANLKDVLAVLKGKAKDSDEAMQFVDAAKACLKADTVAAPKSVTVNAKVSKDISVASGYYLIIEDDSDPLDPTNSAYSRPILTVVGAATVDAKKDVPTLEKKIVEGSDFVDANKASIGDTITYQIKVPVPDMTGYSKYYYIVDDTLSKGLTYTNNVTVTYGTTALTLDTDGAGGTATGDYYVTQGEYSSTNGTAIKFVFEDFYNKFKGVPLPTDIIITYTAKLNQNAVTSTDVGNPNTAKLTYSNDPNADYSGNTDNKPDEPDDGQVTGVTPEDTVTTYTTSLKVIKVDGEDRNTKLAGAEFEISGNGVNQVVVVSKTKFEAATDGTYYKLKDGTYTNTAPSETTASQYDSETTKYKMVTDTESSNEAITNSGTKITAIVDASGELILKGIGAGDYTIKETKAPAGYNLLDSELKFTVKGEITTNNDGTSKISWKTGDSANSKPEYYVGDPDYCVKVEIDNNKGATLPSTGGIGTTIFYVVGGTLVAGAVALLITKKRMSINDQK